MAEPRATRTNLQGAAEAWAECPEVMDFLVPTSPAHRLKLLERDLYLSRWASHVPPGARVLDAGGGIGRFATWCLDRGCTVDLVDPDPRSLEAARRHGAAHGERLRTHEAPAEALPDLAPVDVIIACELLCYVDDPARVLGHFRRLLRPGGVLLASVEAPYGWAMSVDAPAGFVDALFGAGILAVPGDRYVRTYDASRFRDLLAEWVIDDLWYTHYVLSGPFEGVSGDVDLPRLLELEARFRAHPVLAELGRAVAVVAR
ncbi:MAG: class I SAM-dependent methyltransferase [Deltaproteobacteria bacterium]|nr:class I SAM-dependent methyltransferase [Deltaproteobacteria bacterium]